MRYAFYVSESDHLLRHLKKDTPMEVHMEVLIKNQPNYLVKKHIQANELTRARFDICKPTDIIRRYTDIPYADYVASRHEYLWLGSNELTFIEDGKGTNAVMKYALERFED